jgi:cell division protein FtsB
VSWGRWIAAAALVGGLSFGLMGGEYSALDSRSIRRQIRVEQRAIERLTAEVDSLEALATALETDPFVQEKRARERLGMIRDGEMLYTIEPVR